MRQIDYIFIHCAATTASMDIGRHEIDQWHRERGFSGIGYHYVIRRNGQLEYGRSEAQVGAHVEGFNAKSIGVCMVGGVERQNGRLVARDNFTTAQWAELKRLAQELHRKYPMAKILGHRDVNAGKECPSFSVRDWLTRENVLQNGIAWDSGVNADPPAPLPVTRPVIGTAVGGSAGLAALGDTINQNAAQAGAAAAPFPTLQLILALLIVLGSGLVIYSAYRNRRDRGV